jgi:hypothetical protein
VGRSLLPPGRLYTRTHLSALLPKLSPISDSDPSQVCTTELGEVARRAPDFAARGVKVIGLSANDLNSHEAWIKDINKVGDEIGPTNVQFPIVRPSDFSPILIYTCMIDCRSRSSRLYPLRHVGCR